MALRNKKPSPKKKAKRTSKLENKEAKRTSKLKNQEAIDTQGTGVVSITQEQVNELKRKNKIKLIALILCVAIILSIAVGITLVILNKDNPDSVFYGIIRMGRVKVPTNLRVEDFNQERDFEVLIRWTEVFNATHYTLEYMYGLYPDEVQSVNAANNGIRIFRKRGLLKYRVRANKDSEIGEFSQWESFYIEPMRLNKVDKNKCDYYQENNEIIFSWQSIEVQSSNKNLPVYSYELITAQYWKGDDPDYTESNEPYRVPNGQTTYNIMVKKPNNEYIGDYLVLKIRPLNYTVYSDGFTRTEDKSIALYELYGISDDDWVEIEIEIEKE